MLKALSEASYYITGYEYRHVAKTSAFIRLRVVEQVMQATGISITLNTYCDVFSKMHDDAIEKFSNYCIENVCE